ncbi:MAG: GNAT family N-acetyltransferase [Desulfobacterales bacterium]
MEVSVSTEANDPRWDEFLGKDACGEFPQSSAWGRYKQTQGWNCTRVTVRRHGCIAGGGQLLWRPTRFGLRVGYVSKGPVAQGEEIRILDAAFSEIIKIARRLRITALIVQPPGFSRLTSSRLQPPLFLQNRVMRIITATIRIDVSGGMSAVEKRLRRTTRKHVRSAVKGGVRVREGEEKDLDLFFRLMQETCRRRNVAPNPPDVAALRALWKTSGRGLHCRLTFAEHQGRALGGLFCIGFGSTLELWKKGSLADSHHKHPMELLYYDAFDWAASQGYSFCDLGGVSRPVAERTIDGQDLSLEQKHSSDFFKLGFGGSPVLLPEARLHFPNPAVSFCYRLLTVHPGTEKWFRRLSKSLSAG